MSEHGSHFIIPARYQAGSVKSRLMRTFPLAEDGELPRRRHFFDTFDWRLYRKGLTLEEEHTGDGRRVVMRDLRSGAVQRWIDAVEMPRFAEELPRGPFRERLLAITSVRALLPVAAVRTNTHLLRLRDREDKTVARVEIEMAATGANAHIQRLGKRLHVHAVRGHPGPATRLTHFAAEQLHLQPAGNSLLDDALSADGRRALDYSNKPEVELDAGEPAQDAVCRILLRLLQTIEENVQGARGFVDSEYLHDLRVAVRRTRSMIGQLASVFDPATIKPFKTEFKWLGSITSQCRDLDVYLLAFDDYEAAVPEEHRAALEPVRGYLQRRHAHEQRQLAQWLDSTRFRSLIVNWRDYILHPDTNRETAPDAHRKLRKVADERIWHAYRRVRDRGREIKRKTPVTKLHRLRIYCKKLRYLMEFFRGVYPRKKMSSYIGSLKQLQQNLGDLHDYHVQGEALRSFARKMQREGLASPETMAAIDVLAEDLHGHEIQARKDFADVFADFDRPRNRAMARTLFRSRKRKS